MLTRHMMLIALGLLLSVAVVRADDAWSTDLEQAKAQAAKEGKDILIEVTGSDWCPWCMKLRAEVFTKPEFAKEAAKNFVLVSVDFPQKTKLSEAQQKKNDAVQQIFGVERFPTVLLLDEKGRPYSATGYRPGGVEKYLSHVRELQQGKKVRDESLAAADKAEGIAQAQLLDKVLSKLQDGSLLIGYDDLVQRVITLDKDNKEGLQSKYRFYEFERELTLKQYESGLKKLEAFLKQYPLPPTMKQRVYFIKASALEQKGDNAGSLAALVAAQAADPDSETGKQLVETIENFKKHMEKSKKEATDKTDKKDQK